MKYKNTKTGFMFETSDELTGKDWVKLSPDTVNTPEKDAQKEDAQEENPKKKRTSKE